MDMRGVVRNRQGYLYTLAIITMVLPLIVLIVFYSGTSRMGIEDTSARIRCDELYYFVQDVEYDLERAIYIFGRRAALYATDDVITKNRSLRDYNFTNCTDYSFNGNGSEAALAELMLCGTLYGENVTYMMNHTLPVWLDRIEEDALEMRYSLNISVLNISIIPKDAWHFETIVEMDFNVSDKTGLCYYVGLETSANASTDIVGLEDPLYPLHTNGKVRKYIMPCGPGISLDNLAGCSTEDWGEGFSSGNIVFYSNIKDDPGLADYCSTTDDINEELLVFDMAFGSCQGLEYDCFDANHSNRLAGVISYAKNDPESSFIDKCNVTIPWISATGKIDNETQQGQGHQRDPDCSDSNILTGSCVMIKNIGDCSLHQVLMGYSSDSINTTCYMVSNISGYADSCEGDFPTGPSFFDRLDGNLNLSDKYLNQSLEYYGTPYIGIETLVSPYDLASHSVSPNVSSSWVDYLYWADYPGDVVSATCAGGSYDFRLDCPHAYFYGLDTEEVNASGVPPASTISFPANASEFSACPSVNLSGTADDCDGDVSEIWLRNDLQSYNTSWDGSDWNYSFQATSSGIYEFFSMAKDDNGIFETPSSSVVLFITGCPLGDNAPPSQVMLLSPADGEEGVSRTPDLYWNAASDESGIYRYLLQMDQNPADWQSPEVNVTPTATDYHQSDSLSNNKWHSWRVRAQDASGNWGNWSPVWTFKT